MPSDRGTDRRSYLKALAATGGAAMLAGCTGDGGDGGDGGGDGGDGGDGGSFMPASLDDLSGHPVGAQKGTTGESVIQKQLIEQNKLEESNYNAYDNYTLAVQDLENGNIDAIVLDEPVGNTFADQRAVQVAFVYETGERYGFGIRQGDSDRQQALNEGLQAVRDNGTYEELRNEWFGSEDGGSSGDSGGSDGGDGGSGGPEIVAGTAPGFPPFEIKQDGELTGFDVELFEAIVAETEYQFGGWKEFEFDALIPSLRDDKIDAIAAAMTITDERDNAIDFSDPYYSADQSIIVREN
jgi:ABC-type amino acid transport substrate-binding protein